MEDKYGINKKGLIKSPLHSSPNSEERITGRSSAIQLLGAQAITIKKDSKEQPKQENKEP